MLHALFIDGPLFWPAVILCWSLVALMVALLVGPWIADLRRLASRTDHAAGEGGEGGRAAVRHADADIA